MVRISICLSMIALLVCVLPMAAQQPASTDEPGAAVSGSGTTDFIPIWTNSTTLGSSVLFQSGNGAKAKVGIGTTKPASTLDVKGGGTIRGLFGLPAIGTATTTTGFNSQPINLAASVFNSSIGAAVSQNFQWQAAPVGNDTSTATGLLNLLYFPGTASPTEILSIASNGQTTFAAGQTVNGDLSVVAGGVISVGGSRALSCTRSCGAIGSVPNGSITYYGLGSVAAPAGYSLTGCSAYWASSATCGTIQYPATANITALDDGAGACHALGYNGSGSTLESCACVTACELP